MASPVESYNQSLMATCDGQVERSPIDVGARPLPLFGATLKRAGGTNGALEIHLVDMNGIQRWADVSVTATSAEQSLLALIEAAIGQAIYTDAVGAICKVGTADILMGRGGTPARGVTAGVTSIEPFAVGNIFAVGRVAQ